MLKKFDIILDLEDNFERTVKLVLGSADTEPKYDACCAFVTFVGENAPCVDVYNLQSNTSQSRCVVEGDGTGHVCYICFVLPVHWEIG